MTELYANDTYQSFLASAALTGATSITVTDGSIFPAVVAPDFFELTLERGSAPNPTLRERVIVVGRSGDVLTLDPPGLLNDWAEGDKAEHRVTAGILERLRDAAGEVLPLGDGYAFERPGVISGRWAPNGNAIDAERIGLVSVAGTHTIPDPTAGTMSSRRRWRSTTGGAAGSTAAHRSSNGAAGAGNYYWRGNGSNRGGFSQRWLGVGLQAANSDTDFCCGFIDSVTGFTGVDPSTLVNCLLWGFDAFSGNWQLFHNDAAGAATAIDLGSNFPVAAICDFFLYCAPNGSQIEYLARRRDSSVADVRGVLTTNIPANTQFLQVAYKLRNSPGGGTAVAASVDFEEMLIESLRPFG